MSPSPAYQNVNVLLDEELLLPHPVKNIINPNKLTITKHNPSAFFGTSLDAQLRRRKIDTLILSGVATSNGVYATALDAFQHGYHVIVIEDGCSDRDLELHTLFFEKMFPKTARVRTTKEILQAIEEAR